MVGFFAPRVFKPRPARPLTPDGLKIPGEFLEVKDSGIFTSHLDIKTDTKTHREQMWRYFTSFLLTKDFSFLVYIVITLLFFVSLFQRFMGNICVTVIFFASNILSSLYYGAFTSSTPNPSGRQNRGLRRRVGHFRGRGVLPGHQLLAHGARAANLLPLLLPAGLRDHLG